MESYEQLVQQIVQLEQELAEASGIKRYRLLARMDGLRAMQNILADASMEEGI